jgi:TPR repeat protein
MSLEWNFSSDGRFALVMAAFVSVAVVALLLAMFAAPGPRSNDLLYWLKLAGTKDWSKEAAANKPDAQFLLGLSLLRSNLVIVVDSVPRLSSIPVIGKRWFRTVSCSLDSGIEPEQLQEAHAWIKKAVNQGYTPAREMERLFRGRLEEEGKATDRPVTP